MYPSDVRVYIDGRDVTKYIFGSETIELSDVNNTWKNIDISSFLRGHGSHKVEVTAGAGVGRVEVRLEIS